MTPAYQAKLAAASSAWDKMHSHAMDFDGSYEAARKVFIAARDEVERAIAAPLEEAA